MEEVSSRNIPRVPLVLACLGLIPFMILPFWVLIMGPYGLFTLRAVILLQSYAALVLAFMGAIHFAFEIANQQNKLNTDALLSSTSTLLFAWFCLQMKSSTWSLLALAAAFLIVLYLDFARAKQMPLMPKWFPRLKLYFTCGVICSLVLMALI